MNTDYPITRAASFWVLLFSAVLIFTSNTLAQTPSHTNSSRPKQRPSQEKKFLRHILHDQRGIWTSPFHMRESDSKWLAPLGLSTIALVVTDRRTSSELVENGDNRSRLRISKDISRMGSLYATGGVAAASYFTGRAMHNERARETGLLGAEALIDSVILGSAVKTISQRQRPLIDHSSGEFFDGGSSFPSGHAINAWTLATVIAQEYGHHRPVVHFGAYGLAAAISVSRYTGRNHFLSDVLVGSAIGYGIGRYVYHQHHDPALDALNEKQSDDLARSKLFPRLAPLYNPRAHVYGAMMTWSF